MIEFLTVTLIILLAAISPGPDFAIVMQNALQRGQRPGIMTALGVSCSLVIHATYSILGLAIVISQSLLLFSLIKYLGAAYLIYIGVKNVFAKSNTNTQNKSSFISKTHSRQDFTEGFLCNLLNPKAIMFILAFFTLVIKSTSTLAAQFGYAIEIALIHFIWFSALAIMVNHQTVRNKLQQIQHYIVKLLGVALIGFGAKIALLSQAGQ